LSDGFVFGANDSAHIVSKAIVADVLTLKEILCDNLVNFLDSVCTKSILVDIELDDTLVGLQTTFERWCIALFNLVA